MFSIFNYGRQTTLLYRRIFPPVLEKTNFFCSKENPIKQDKKSKKNKSKKKSLEKVADLTPRLYIKNCKGMRDHEPRESVIRNRMIRQIKEVFVRHEAEQIETPVLEVRQFLDGVYGEGFVKERFDISRTALEEEATMRFDLTVPFARYLAQRHVEEITRYQIGAVYRKDNCHVSKGRFREFYQCDYDIAGKFERMVPDAKCIDVIKNVLDVLNIGPYVVRVSHRLLLSEVLKSCGVSEEKIQPVCSTIDKLDKRSWEHVHEELVSIKGLDSITADLIGTYVQLKGGRDFLQKIKSDTRLQGNEGVVTAIADLELLLDHTEILECQDSIIFDLSLARGLDYYTGVMFEAVLTNDISLNENNSELGESLQNTSNATNLKNDINHTSDNYEKSKIDSNLFHSPEDISEIIPSTIEGLGSVAAGGRYDDLVGKFVGDGSSVPCVGVSFGFERLFALLELKQEAVRTTSTQVFVMSIGKEMSRERMRVYKELYKAGVSVGWWMKPKARFLQQLQYAERKGIPFAVVVGEDELKEGVVIVRTVVKDPNQREGNVKDVRVKRENMVEYIREALNTIS